MRCVFVSGDQRSEDVAETKTHEKDGVHRDLVV